MKPALLCLLALPALAAPPSWRVVSSRIEAAYLAACDGQFQEILPTGSNAAYWGNLPGFVVVRPVAWRDVRRGDMVVRRDFKVCHLVSRTAGPLVYTKGASNPAEDGIPVSGELFLVERAYFYHPGAFDAAWVNGGQRANRGTSQ